MSTTFDTDFDGNAVEDGLDPNFDQWLAEMTHDENSEYVDPEDADWNENIFEGEDDDDDETPAPVIVKAVVTAPKVRDAKKCREWAKAQNMVIGDRGVISAEVWNAYLAS